jgi:hypothetical protein
VSFGLTTGGAVNFNIKKAIFILFINNRLVDNSDLRKAMDMVYAPYLPKGQHSFVYLKMDIPPEDIDVNVHPTKREVKFLNEAAIIGRPPPPPPPPPGGAPPGGPRRAGGGAAAAAPAPAVVGAGRRPPRSLAMPPPPAYLSSPAEGTRWGWLAWGMRYCRTHAAAV